jgi:hypothetical protein
MAEMRGFCNIDNALAAAHASAPALARADLSNL